MIGILTAAVLAFFPASAKRADGPAAPAATIRVGDPSVNGALLRPYRNTFAESVLRPDGTTREGTRWTDELAETNLQGRPLWRRTIVVYRSSDDAIISTGGALFDRATLAPISSAEKLSVEEFWSVDFSSDGRSAVGVRAARGAPARFLQWTAEEAAFDLYNGTFGLLLAVLPLREGETGTIPAVVDEKSGVASFTYRVGGRESLSFGATTVEAGVVTVEDPNGSSVYWLRPEPPFLLKIRRTAIQPAGTFVYTWTALP